MNIKLRNALTALVLFLTPGVNYAQAPTLGHAAGFVLFTTNGALTGSGTKYLTHLTGNVGANLAGSVTGFGNVDGVIHQFDVATKQCAPDVISLYTQLSTAIPTAPLASPFGLGNTLGAGVYKAVGAATLSSDLILDGGGDPNALFIFQIGGVLTTTSSSKIKLINGALACNVFWQVGGAVNVGTGTTLRGTIVANGQIDMTSTLDTLEGRALALNAAVLVSQLVAYTPIGCGSPLLTGPLAPALASTGTYGVFSSIGAVTSTTVTYVIGDVGANSTTPTGFDPLNVTGTIHHMDASTGAAAADLTNVYNYLVAMPADINLLDPADFGHDLVLTPHAYQMTGITQFTGNVYLNAEGDANAVFVIKVNGSFTSDVLAKVMLINGAQAKNVYWKIDGAVDLFSGTLFNGTMVVAGAISLETGDTLIGRALTINGAVAINASYIGATPSVCTAPPISGTKNICPGNTTVLTDATTGGTWLSGNPSVATIDSNTGMVTGIAPGNANIQYTTTAGCIATDTFRVNSLPSLISGPNNVCVGSSITLSDSTSGGSWSSSNTSLATVGSGSGVVAGIANGAPVISYAIPGGCAITTIINVGPSANTISGSSNVCIGATITLTDTVAGGTWSRSNGHALVIGNLVTGVSAGIDTISYSYSGACGAVTATKTVTVDSATDAGTITGAPAVCIGGTIALADAVPGGTWGGSNSSALVSGNLVTGVSAGIDTIAYTVTGSCGTGIATKIVNINTANSAGTITGLSTVCPSATISLTDLTTGGIWSSSNTTATVSGGVVTGLTPGTDTIRYFVASGCGFATATKTVTINALPNAGSINGALSVCVSATIALSDAITGGMWSSSNATAAVGSTGMVTGVAAGTDTIMYSVTNVCSTAMTMKTITVNPLPVAGSITGSASVCVGVAITLTDNAPGGLWSSSSSKALVSGGVVTGISAGLNTISYSVTNICGTDVAIKTITINPLPDAGKITGASAVCIGASITLTDMTTGGVWSSSNVNATVVGGVVTGIIAGTGSINYAVTNICGIANTTSTITINPLPAVPVIGLSAAASVCDSVFFQNFGAATLPPSGVRYSWSAVNAMISDTGSTTQYALVNFKNPGVAVITLTSTGMNNGCKQNSAAFSVNVGTDRADVPPEVIYFTKSFVCLQNDEEAYQWGYDDATTLAPTTIQGETNQDYVISNPDQVNNKYWVKVTHNGCTQKAYYIKPSGAAMKTSYTDVTVSPNPAKDNITVQINTNEPGNMQVEVWNMLGQKLYAAATGNTAQVDVSRFPAGIYLLVSYRDGVKISSARFVKN